MRRLVSYFIQGLFFVIPLSIIIYLIYWIEQKIASLYSSTPHIIWIVISLVLFILAVGFLTSNLLTKPLITYIENLIMKIPLFGMIYSSTKDLMSAFVGDKRKFNQPVLVKVNDEESIERIGFITNQDLSMLGIEDKVAVYLPHSYAFSGWVVIVPKKNITPISAKASEVMLFLVSGGVTLKKEEETPNNHYS
ncbi:MAG: DUF502 domain-containing protein [Bacteroidia bacterium]|nr:DUF502 domain-containing protein [Bacteroidia bacterium]MDW8301496.1 DUF502 domain-containing protein [Bacteroidia bacterium]